MRLGKKKLAIGIALGTLVLAVLAFTTIGSASKCSTECSGTAITEQWLSAKTGMKDSVKSAYAGSIVTSAKFNTSNGSKKDQTVRPSTNNIPRKVIKTSTAKETEKMRKALIALFLVAATESIQHSVAH